MNKKRVLEILIISFFLVAPAFAKSKQQPPPQPLTTDEIVAKMKFQLGLTDEQAIEVKPIIVNHLAEELKLKLEEQKQLRKVLTDQQLYTWNFLQNEPPKEKKKSKL